MDRPGPDLDPDDLLDDIEKARDVVETCARVVSQMPVY